MDWFRNNVSAGWTIIIVSVIGYGALLGFAKFTTYSLADMEKVATIAVPFLIGAGFYFAWKQFDAIRRARMAETILSLAERWDSQPLEDSRRAVNKAGTPQQLKSAIEKAHHDDDPGLCLLIRVGNYFDTVGEIVNRGYLDKNMVYDLLGPPALHYAQCYSSILKDTEHKGKFKCFQDLDEALQKVKTSKLKARPTPP